MLWYCMSPLCHDGAMHAQGWALRIEESNANVEHMIGRCTPVAKVLSLSREKAAEGDYPPLCFRMASCLDLWSCFPQATSSSNLLVSFSSFFSSPEQLCSRYGLAGGLHNACRPTMVIMNPQSIDWFRSPWETQCQGGITLQRRRITSPVLK